MSTLLQPSQTIRHYLARDHKMLVDGVWVSAVSRDRFDVVSPISEQVIASVPRGGAADIHNAVAAARKAFNSKVWWNLGPARRAQILWRVAELIDQHTDEIAELDCVDNGMPISDAKMVGIPFAAEVFRYFAGWASKIQGHTSQITRGGKPILGYTLRQPVGVAGLIIPWNSPFLMAGLKVAQALAAGCCCVLKPAEETPLSALRFGELLTEAGVPPGVVNIVTGFGHEAGAALAAHPGVDKIAFTGSTEVGKLIVQAALGNLKKVTLELGGKSPVIVFDDADHDKAIKAAAASIFRSAGQTCIAGSRLYVQRKSYEKVVQGIAAIAEKLRMGQGLDQRTEMGPLVSDKQRQRVLSYIDSGISEGGRLVTGGAADMDSGYFVRPTVMADVRAGMRVVDEEIFGPVICAQAFDDEAEVLTAAADTRYGLAAYVWTRDLARAHSFAEALPAGSVALNLHDPRDLSMPFGGFKQSGWGREFGAEGLDGYLETKSVFAALD